MGRPASLEGKVERLPQWAQNYINKLERDIEHWKAAAAQATGEAATDTRVMIDYGSDWRGLPRGAAIRFGVRPWVYIEARVVEETEAHLDVEIRGQETVAFLPKAQNTGIFRACKAAP